MFSYYCYNMLFVSCKLAYDIIMSVTWRVVEILLKSILWFVQNLEFMSAYALFHVYDIPVASTIQYVFKF